MNNSQSQSYYFVLREDQSNNVYNFTIPNPPSKYTIQAVGYSLKNKPFY